MSQGHSDLVYSQLYTTGPLSTPPREEKEPQALDPETMYELTKKKIDDLDIEINYIDLLLDAEREKRLAAVAARSPDIQAFCSILGSEKALHKKLTDLLDQQDTLRWRALGSQSSIGMRPAALERLLDIQKDTGQATAALAAFGAGLSLSILFSATRGNMWWFFASWWCFIMSVAVTGMLSIATAGSDPSSARATHFNWISRRFSVLVITISYFGVILGLASFCVGAAQYDVGPELHGEAPKITGGPDLFKFGDKIRPAAAIIAYIVIGTLALGFFCAYLIRVGMVVRFKDRAQRRKRAHSLVAPIRPHRTATDIELGDDL